MSRPSDRTPARKTGDRSQGRQPLRGFALSALRSLGPAIGPASLGDAIRTGAGAGAGIALTAAAGLAIAPGNWTAAFLIAPFGATAVLVFAVPNSPLAQPWSAIVGNTVAALTALLVTRLIADPLLAIPLSVGAAVLAMALARSTHPPGGAVALTIALASAHGTPVGWSFALLPVAVGTALLVAAGAIWARLTGRRYPFRQFKEVNANRTQDRAPAERLGLDRDDLAGILARYRQSLNLGVEDLARLIAAAEIQAAANRSTIRTAAEVMSRDLVTVLPDTPRDTVADLFIRHGFTSLPVVDAKGHYLGVIFQRHLLGHTGAQGAQTAAALMTTAVPTAAPHDPVSALLAPLAIDGTDAVPVRDGPVLVGIVTRTDLIAALAHDTALAPVPPSTRS